VSRFLWFLRWYAPLLACSAQLAAGRVEAQDTSIWSGVYTAVQAERGKTVYARHCSRCHGDDLGGTRNYPLAGEPFMDHWEAHTLEHLFRRIRDSMPPGDAGSVTDADKRDAMAYLLQQNGFPAGRNDLAQDDDELASVQITRKTGPGPLKTGALVRVTGCLAQPHERDWELTHSAEPERTTLDAVPTADDQPSTIAPGTRTLRLLNAFPSPTAHVGHTMQAIGFLVKNSSGEAVNVVSLKMLAPSCAR
jgi:mono/diheme cytochrome c family protein